MGYEAFGDLSVLTPGWTTAAPDRTSATWGPFCPGPQHWRPSMPASADARPAGGYFFELANEPKIDVDAQLDLVLLPDDRP
jgi:hypothetical protein